ncbi:RagB/SusD family nutrient uptake outer membrane protein [Puia sp.]|jgi:hypothetical protein|uniref:RagB/SusD family nutrient uptake outer membrane protein n=1 Tax=Puia sp. TaxID=2045100 RepID=UPI002F3E5E4E
MRQNIRLPLFLALPLAVVILNGCSKNLNQVPQATATNSAVFGSVQGLQLYANSFYDGLPTAATTVRGDDQYGDADYGARNAAPIYLQDGAFGSRQATGWTWTTLRNLNYFIANAAPNPGVPEATRLSYIGLARFFRAYFYFSMVQQFGNVPWVGKPLGVSDSALYSARTDRTTVMDSVLADINYAIANINVTTDPTSSMVTKWVAYGLKSRMCLYEGTWRRYQSDSLETAAMRGEAQSWLQNAASAAKAVMDSSGFTLNTAGGNTLAYRNLFISTSPVSSEVMLSTVMSQSLAVLNDANWYYTSATYGTRYSFTRRFINTYLNADGTPFTDITRYDTLPFVKETKNRDGRLSQTIRMGSYTRISSGKTVAAPPVFSYTYTGYMPIKWSMDDTYYDANTTNINSVCLMRYAEMLLNYAEATEELKNYGGPGLSGAEWTKTIGALRSRAGITGNLGLPTTVDPYIQQYYTPTDQTSPAVAKIADPVLLEIRRERGIELVLEGFRFNDLCRWRLGDLLQQSWNGMYVPALNVPMDLNGDGVLDVCFYQGTQPANISGVTFINVSPTLNGTVNPMQLSNGTYGEIHWLDNVPRQWHNYKYLYPIPNSELLLNPNLGQNPVWQ